MLPIQRADCVDTGVDGHRGVLPQAGCAGPRRPVVHLRTSHSPIVPRRFANNRACCHYLVTHRVGGQARIGDAHRLEPSGVTPAPFCCQDVGIGSLECAPALVAVKVVRPVGRSTLTAPARRRVGWGAVPGRGFAWVAAAGSVLGAGPGSG